jgi:hypothetical protein
MAENDTLSISRRLSEAGFETCQADSIALVLYDVFTDPRAPAPDLKISLARSGHSSMC